ncbi:nucleotidyltransferase substrate binding protein [Nodosilinea sp. LEGE 07298]|uniref:nucleotidyltransferase substrate binding protein n=1 Tax=Nodosilinea sp. LEGE 07298 TaxID=2777970 RepID=UPI001882AE01|nr:nucleotidyltransferase substrate binding protein [Nodosilinea sp. LEGE 07298]MBE9111855.1 nucleotidyltransferase substrate binding protein [Nodosilinea sp. LEGE 07298]
MIDYDNLQKALKHLEAQYANYKTLDPAQPPLIQEAVAESVIQRFETCYDALWKVLKRYLIEELGLPEVPNSPKPILRLANENGLLASTAELWMAYANARIGTAHDYSGEKAQAALALMEAFLSDATALYQRMSGQPWT